MVNKSTGNMYSFITDTFNTIKGECPHGCTYCYMKRWGKQKPVRLDKKEFKTDLGSGKFIFVGSSCDMFAESIPDGWIYDTLEYLRKFDNKYLLQTKNPERLERYTGMMDRKNTVICTTIETNKFIRNIMIDSPHPYDRAQWMNEIHSKGFKTYVTIEPIMNFDLDDMVYFIQTCQPTQVNIGADSGKNNLPEPSKEKILALIEELNKFTDIDKKTNLKRLLI